MKTSAHLFLLMAAAMLFSLPAAGPASASSDGLVSYRASYELSLGKTKGLSTFAAAEGRITRTVELTCDGWVTAERLEMSIYTTAGGRIDRTRSFSSWESLDGLEYRFTSRSETNEGVELFKGTAKLDSIGGPGTATYEDPEEKTIDLPKGTYFPSGQIKVVVDALRRGDIDLFITTFDGTEENGPEGMSSFKLGNVKPIEGERAEELGKSATDPGWRLDLAFFDPTETQGIPSFQVVAEVLENGILRDMVMDFGEFTLVQELRRADVIDPPKC